MFVLHCGTGRKNAVYCAFRFYSTFIISQLEEKVRKPTGRSVSAAKWEEEEKTIQPKQREIPFFFLCRHKAAERARQRVCVPLGNSSFSLDYPAGKASQSLPSSFHSLPRQLKHLSRSLSSSANYYLVFAPLSFIFCSLVNKESSSASWPRGPAMVWTMNCCGEES